MPSKAGTETNVFMCDCVVCADCLIVLHRPRVACASVHVQICVQKRCVHQFSI